MDYLYIRNNQYYFRYQLPPELKLLISKCEIKFSLQTGNKKEAKLKSAYLLLAVSNIKKLHKAYLVNSISDIQVRKELDRILKELISYYGLPKVC